MSESNGISKLILIPLLICLSITIFYGIIAFGSFVLPFGDNADFNAPSGTSNSGSTGLFSSLGGWILNGFTQNIAISMSFGIIILITSIVLIIALLGIQGEIKLVSSGFAFALSETSIRTILYVGVLGLAWVLLGIPSLSLLMLIPYSLGTVFFFLLTMIYFIGILDMI